MYHLTRASIIVLLCASGLVPLAGQESRLTLQAVSQGGPPTYRVQYSPGTAHASASAQLRARLRRGGDLLDTRTVNLATLHRDGSSFEGSFTWPDSVVFMTLAVNVTGVDRPDTNDGQYWEALHTSGNGAPSIAAMRQRVLDRVDPGRQQYESGLAAARDLVAAFPDAPEGWALLSRLEEIVLGPARTEESKGKVHAALLDLDRRYRAMKDTGPDAVEAFAMYWQGRDSAAAEYWSERLLATYPRTEFARQVRLSQAMALAGTDAPGTFLVLDSLWEAAESIPVASAALALATRSKDPARMRRWGERLTALSGNTVTSVARDFLNVPELAADGLRLLEQRRAALDSDTISSWPLDAGAATVRTARSAAAAALARALLAKSDTARAAALYDEAAAHTWNARLLSEAAAVSLALRDTAAAVGRYARAAASGLAPADMLPAAESAIPGLRSRGDWTQSLAAARAEYAAEVMADDLRKPIDQRLTVVDSTGQLVSLGQLAGRRPLVIAFWTPNCQPSVRALGDIASLADFVEQQGGRFVAVVAEQLSGDVRAQVASHKVSRSQYYVGDQALIRALGQWGTPNTYVLDSHGTLRFAHSTPAQARVQYAVLLEQQ